MTHDDRSAWVRALLAEALDLPAGERAAFLDARCGDDDGVRREVQALIAELDDAGTIALGAEGSPEEGTDAWEALLTQLASYRSPTSRYDDHGEFARGGMGQIRHVYDKSVRRRLAMKILLDRDGGDAEGSAHSLGHFLEEAQVAGQLDHPGIVPVHELGVDAEGRIFFTMKLVKGEDLRSVFDRVADPNDEEWNTTRALNVMHRVCEAMAYAHDKGVIHRDLKPGNVMVGKYGETYVMDWGLAKVLGRKDSRDLRIHPDATASLKTARRDAAAETPDSPIMTMDGAVVGTPAYMPPEQAKGRIEEVGPPADVYAVGAMLHHLLSGRMPYTEPGDRISARMILLAVTQGPPKPLAVLAPTAPAELVAIVEKAMAQEIGDRYPDMMALARDLRAYLETRVVAAYETGAWAELKKWVARNKALAITSAAAVVVVAALATWSNLTIREERRVAQSERDTAEAERDRVLRLADKRRLDVLLDDADQLWPAHPENEEGLTKWLGRVDELLAKLPLHEETLAEVRAKGTPLPHPREDELRTLREHLAKHVAGEEVDGEEFDDEAARAEHVGSLEAAIALLHAAIARGRDHAFGEDADARWWHDAVRDLVIGLQALKEDDIHAATVAGVEARLAWAKTIAERSTSGADVAAKWAEARAAIKAHSTYDGLDLAPQIGLVPLGPDPASTLWEFGHLRTGDLPARDPETGRLAITEATGLVFVLIPGGTYRIGDQIDPDEPHFDPQAQTDESPVHEISLSPYFLSKYEMTQGQWARFTGENPSHWMAMYPNVTSLAHPLDNVTWDMCRTMLDRLGLALPTEAQWEAACRAGTESVWSFGDDVTEFPEHGNMKDATYAKAFTGTDPTACESFHDDRGPPAKVGTFQANGFGLHDMHGNVWEWCRDGFGAYTTPGQAGDALRVQIGATLRVFRGGSYAGRAFSARSAGRGRGTPEARDNGLGCRPAQGLSSD